MGERPLPLHSMNRETGGFVNRAVSVKLHVATKRKLEPNRSSDNYYYLDLLVVLFVLILQKSENSNPKCKSRSTLFIFKCMKVGIRSYWDSVQLKLVFYKPRLR